MATANDIYSVDKYEQLDEWYVRENLANHVYELDMMNMGNLDDNVELSQITMRQVAFYDIDGRRYVELVSVWFNEQPVMIIQNAGREGRDHRQMFVTNNVLYNAMLKYILIQYAATVGYSSNDIELDVDVPELTNFYGYNWDDEIK